MKRDLKLIRAAGAVVFLALAGCSAPSHHASRAWEYRVVQGYSGPSSLEVEKDRAEFERQLNDAGAQGYTVVSITMVPGDASIKTRTVVIMKRPKQSSSAAASAATNSNAPLQISDWVQNGDKTANGK